MPRSFARLMPVSAGISWSSNNTRRYRSVTGTWSMSVMGGTRATCYNSTLKKSPISSTRRTISAIRLQNLADPHKSGPVALNITCQTEGLSEQTGAGRGDVNIVKISLHGFRADIESAGPAVVIDTTNHLTALGVANATREISTSFPNDFLYSTGCDSRHRDQRKKAACGGCWSKFRILGWLNRR